MSERFEIVDKIGCNFLSLKDTSVEDFIKTAYDLRLDVVDFHQRAFPSTDPAALSAIKGLCLRYGLPIGYIGVSGLFHGTGDERRQHADNAKAAVDLAAFLGSPIIRLFIPVPRRFARGRPMPTGPSVTVKA